PGLGHRSGSSARGGHFGQVGDAGPGVQPGQHVIGARVVRQLAHARAGVVQVPEHDRLRRAALRARRQELQLGVIEAPVAEARLVLLAADALHAERALLHHALLAHRDVRIEQQVQRLRPRLELATRLRVIEPVEVADLVGAVVGAVARADAAVVDLPVEPVGRVIRREYGADRLARRVAALLAQHRRGDGVQWRAVLAAGEIALDAHPAHLAMPAHQLLPDGREVVLGVTGRHARRAAGAAR